MLLRLVSQQMVTTKLWMRSAVWLILFQTSHFSPVSFTALYIVQQYFSLIEIIDFNTHLVAYFTNRWWLSVLLSPTFVCSSCISYGVSMCLRISWVLNCEPVYLSKRSGVFLFKDLSVTRWRTAHNFSLPSSLVQTYCGLSELISLGKNKCKIF